MKGMKEINEAIRRLNRLQRHIKQDHWENSIAKQACLMGIRMSIAKLIAYREELKTDATD